MKNAVVVGLGLIGGSMAKAIKKYTDMFITGIDTDELVIKAALEDGVIDAACDENALTTADLIIISLYPEEAVEYIKKHGDIINKKAIVTDVAGIKQYICREMPALARKYGFEFIGSHPMAGKENSGYFNSEAELFKGASYILISDGASHDTIDIMSEFAVKIGFAQVVVASAKEHDAMIAYTSQLPHVLASAYVQSPRCLKHKGFSAGSYRDVSRVAKLNEYLWAELFIQNREPLIEELNILIENITAITDAVNKGDREKLIELLGKGRIVKEALGE